MQIALRGPRGRSGMRCEAGKTPPAGLRTAGMLNDDYDLGEGPLVPEGAADGGRPTAEEAEAAVRTLIRWAGDDPDREGLLDTPKRVAKAYRELYSGYDMCAADELGRTFEEVAGYDDMVLIKDIHFYSHCEHHMVPITGKAHVAYLPD